MDTDTHSVFLFERVIHFEQLGTIIFSGSDQELELTVYLGDLHRFKHWSLQHCHPNYKTRDIGFFYSADNFVATRLLSKQFSKFVVADLYQVSIFQHLDHLNSVHHVHSDEDLQLSSDVFHHFNRNCLRRTTKPIRFQRTSRIQRRHQFSRFGHIHRNQIRSRLDSRRGILFPTVSRDHSLRQGSPEERWHIRRV